jgi:hypothetical protein
LFCRWQAALELSRQFGLELVFGYADRVLLGFEREFDFDIVLFRAEDDADGNLSGSGTSQGHPFEGSLSSAKAHPMARK